MRSRSVFTKKTPTPPSIPKSMASIAQVKQYLACWFLLGKKVLLHNGDRSLLPSPVFENGGYSRAFEDCWQEIELTRSGDCYLEGTKQTIQELLKPEWDFIMCSRCTLPIPVPVMGMAPNSCPCNDLTLWPNTEVPLPRLPANNQNQLRSICTRLENFSNQPIEEEEANSAPDPEPDTSVSIIPIPTEIVQDIPFCHCGSEHEEPHPIEENQYHQGVTTQP